PETPITRIIDAHLGLVHNLDIEAGCRCAASGTLFRRSPVLVDWLVQRGGFELPRPFRILWAEFGPSLVHDSARIKASVLARICSPGIRPDFGSLRFASSASRCEALL